MRSLVIWCALVASMAVGAQSQVQSEWEMYLKEVMTAEDMESAAWEESYELLQDLAQQPMNLNRATREELEQLPFLSAQQVEELMEYRHRYGAMKSEAELQMIRSLDYTCRRLLTYFIYIGEAEEQPQHARRQHELMATGRVPLYQRRGDEGAYQGYPYRHWLRYQLTVGDRLKAGIVGAQDAGEPFFGGHNRLGYDYYSYYLQIDHWKRIERLVVGKYRVSMGMGLVANTSFAQGKLATLQSMGRTAATLRAHSSRSAADYLQGAAATVSLARGLTATAFLSYRGQDATLNKDGTAATILTTGYHRTETEMAKKNNLRTATFGGSIRYQAHGLHGGLNVVGSHLDRELRPNTSALYRQHYAQGSDFLNVSADYGYTHHRFAFNGETALNHSGALATIHSLSMQVGDGWSLMALQRFYSYRYTSLLARSFSDGGSVQNESGLYLGASWQPSPAWRLTAYADYAYFPWAKYQVSQSSHSWDWLLQASHTRRRWTFGCRYRLRLRQKDDDSKTALMQKTEHRARLSADYAGGTSGGAASGGAVVWSSRTQADFSLVSLGDRERGLMVSQTLGCTLRRLRLSGGIGYFRTDGYDSRLYLYEQGPLYNYGFMQFSGEGIRYWLMARAQLGRHLTLTAKAAITDYFDRATIGTGYQQIDASSQTDIDLQLRWKF